MWPQILVVAYFTPNNSYQRLSQNLKESLQSFKLPHLIKPVQDLGSWENNTHYKSKFIKECLETQTQDLLYVDVDAVFKAYPQIFETLDCDIAYRTENFRWRADEALSGTVYFRNNEKVKRMVDRWINLNEATPAERMKPETWEQKNMQRAQREFSDLVYYNLPPEYTFITDHTKTMYPGLFPVIEHFQASREVHRNTNQKSNLRIRR
jgi:hypothetical protein